MRSSHKFHLSLIIGLVCIGTLVSTAEAQGNWKPGDRGSLRLFIGEFAPDGESAYWDEKFRDFTGSPSDFNDFIIMGDIRQSASDFSSVLFGFSFYESSASQAYHSWVDVYGRDLRHTTSLKTYDVTGTWVYEFGSRRHMITPYAGVGGGYLWWNLTEVGDFIDFSEPDLPTVHADYGSSGSTFEILAMAGVDIRISDAFSILVQGRWRYSDDQLGASLAGLGTLDLSGYDYELGLAYHF